MEDQKRLDQAVLESTMRYRLKSVWKQTKDDLWDYTLELEQILFTIHGWKHLAVLTKDNWKSGLTVALVNLPLSISLAVAANATPVAGLVTAFWAGLLCSLFGGSNYNITGPTGALSGILAKYVIEYGPNILPILALYSGIITLVFFAFKWERFVLFVPSSVMEGFTLGVALIIALNQLNFAFGLASGYERHEEFWKNVRENLNHLEDTSWYSVVITVVTFLVLYFLLYKYPKIPWVLIMCLLGIALGAAVSVDWIPIKLQTLESRYGNLPLTLVTIPELNSDVIQVDVIMASFSVAFIAILETLISAKIADGLTKTTFQQRREVFGLALGNIACGIVGGIPATAALARTALNVSTGGNSRMSAFINSMAVLVLGVALLRLFKYLPLPIIAAILILVAVKMVKFHHVIRYFKVQKSMFFLTILVAVLCVVLEPTVGIVAGMMISLLLLSDNIARGHGEVVMKTVDGKQSLVSDTEIWHSSPKKLKRNNTGVTDLPQMETFGASVVVYRIAGQLTYINAFSHKERIKALCENRNITTVVISLRFLFYVDIDGLDAIGDIIEHLKVDKKVLLSGINSSIYPMVSRTDWYREQEEGHKVFAHYKDALSKLQGASSSSDLEMQGQEKPNQMTQSIQLAINELQSKND